MKYWEIKCVSDLHLELGNSDFHVERNPLKCPPLSQTSHSECIFSCAYFQFQYGHSSCRQQWLWWKLIFSCFFLQSIGYLKVILHIISNLGDYANRKVFDWSVMSNPALSSDFGGKQNTPYILIRPKLISLDAIICVNHFGRKDVSVDIPQNTTPKAKFASRGV